MTRIIALSDTHGLHGKVKVPDGDLLIFAGDLMNSGYDYRDIKDFSDWFSSFPHSKKIFIAGNHDRMFEERKDYALSFFPKDIVYLENSSCIYNGLKIYGSPQTPEFCNWAFNVPRGERIKQYWDMIPSDTNILVSHGPPYGILDQVDNRHYKGHFGCEELAKAINRVNPKICLFGHIHGGHGHESNPGNTEYYNISVCDERYRPINPVTVIDIEV